MTRSRRAVAAFILALVALAVTGGTTLATKPDPEHKVAICHRTASDTNPYVFIEVDEASLDAHFNNLPGHPAKAWKTDGTFRGVAHVAGDLKSDYLASSEADCIEVVTDSTPEPTPTVDPTPSPSVAPTPEQSLAPPVVRTHDVPNTAMDFQSGADLATLLGIALLAFALGAMSFRALVLRRLR